MPQSFSALNYLLPIFTLGVSILFVIQKGHREDAPILLFTVLWFFLLSIHGVVSGMNLVALSTASLMSNFLITLSVLSLTFSFVFWRRTLGSFRSSSGLFSTIVLKHKSATLPKWVLLFIACYSMLITAAMYIAATRIVGSSDVIGSLQFLRHSINYGDASWGWIGYASTPITVFSVYLLVLSRGEGIIGRLILVVTVLCALFIAIISTQRTSIFLLLIAMAFGGSERSLPNARSLMFLGFFLMASFLGVGYFVGKIGSNEASFLTTVYAGRDAFLLYLLTPISAFDASQIWTDPSLDMGYSVRFFQAVLQKLGFSAGELKVLIMPYVYVPKATNVYSFAFVPISDLGIFFPFYYFLVGGLLAFAFSLPRSVPVVRVLQGICYYPLIMTIYQDQFLTLFSTWIQILVVLAICHYLTLFNAGRRSFSALA